MAVGFGGVAQQQAQCVAIGQQTHPLMPCPQHPLRRSGGTEPVGAAGAAGRVQIGFGRDRPSAQSNAAGRQQPPAVLRPLPRCDRVLAGRIGVTQNAGQRRDDIVMHPLRTADPAQRADALAHGGPSHRIGCG